MLHVSVLGVFAHRWVVHGNDHDRASDAYAICEGCCMVVHQSAVSNVITMGKLPAHQQEGKCEQQHMVQ